MFDCGIHPAYPGESSLPLFKEIDPSEIDLLLITHFHLDHCGALPYFVAKTNFCGRVFTTYPTKAIYKHLLYDFIKVSSQHTMTSNDKNYSLFSQQDIDLSIEKTEVLN